MIEGIQRDSSADRVIMQLLIRWVAMLHSRFKLGEDGKSAYEREKGRKCIEEVVPFDGMACTKGFVAQVRGRVY